MNTVRAVDFHAHAFPDNLAARAVQSLQEGGEAHAYLNGTVADLLASMDRNGVEKSVICSIATKPTQFEPILGFSAAVRSDRIEPFPSVHPDDPEAVEKIARVREAGFRGIKLHPYYQNFYADEERMRPIYEAVSRAGMILTMHTGYDWAFERVPRADPARMAAVQDAFPDLKLVLTHLGAWDDWDEVEKHLLGREIRMEISLSLELLSSDRARAILSGHPEDYLFFGTDSPWSDQGETLDLLRGLGLEPERERKLLRDNALRLLASV